MIKNRTMIDFITQEFGESLANFKPRLQNRVDTLALKCTDEYGPPLCLPIPGGPTLGFLIQYVVTTDNSEQEEKTT